MLPVERNKCHFKKAYNKLVFQVFLICHVVIVMVSKTVCSHPNIVIFIADDLGYGDVGGAFGNETLPTPNIDKIGTRGVSFTHSLAAASVCTPSRAALLTSRYPIRNGMTSPGKNRVIFFTASPGGLPMSEVTLPKILKTIGYSTALIGKWHLGKDQHSKGDMIHHPLKHGFDYFYGLPLSNIKDFGHRTSVVTSYFPNMYYWFSTIAVIGLSLGYSLKSRKRRVAAMIVLFITVAIPLIITLFIKSFPTINSILMRNDKVIEQPIVLEGITSRFVNESINFMENAIKERNPFFLMMSFVKVHSAHFPSRLFKGKSRHGLYGDCVMELDWGVGEIVSHLEKSNIMNDTIIIFTSDNGGHVEEHDENGVQEGGYNGVLRGGKGHGAMEGGIRVPTLISWPNHFPKNVIFKTPISLMDFFPTILEIVKQPIPENIDGRSFLPLLTQKSKDSPHKFLYHYCGTYLHGVTFIQDPQHIWKMYLYTPKFVSDYEYRCEFMCQCFGDYVIKHSPPKIYNLAVDVTEKVEIDASSNTYQHIKKEVDDAIEDHEQNLIVVDSQFSFKNSIWRPDLQECCKFPFCTCRE